MEQQIRRPRSVGRKLNTALFPNLTKRCIEMILMHSCIKHPQRFLFQNDCVSVFSERLIAKIGGGWRNGATKKEVQVGGKKAECCIIPDLNQAMH